MGSHHGDGQPGAPRATPGHVPPSPGLNIKPLFLRGVRGLEGGRLTSHNRKAGVAPRSLGGWIIPGRNGSVVNWPMVIGLSPHIGCGSPSNPLTITMVRTPLTTPGMILQVLKWSYGAPMNG